MTLRSFASKPIWPQVLAAANLKPQPVLLLRSEHVAASHSPAQRLLRLFDNSGLVPKDGHKLMANAASCWAARLSVYALAI